MNTLGSVFLRSAPVLLPIFVVIFVDLYIAACRF